MNMSSSQYRKSHRGYRTVVRSSLPTIEFPIYVRQHRYVESEAHFNNDFSIPNQIRQKIHLAVFQLLVIISQQQFAHATTAHLIILCAKYCSDHLVRIGMRAKWNFYRTSIVMKKMLVIWVPSQEWIYFTVKRPHSKWPLRSRIK